MYTKDKVEIELADSTIDVNPHANITFVRMHGDGTCKIRAVWKDKAGDTHAEKKDLSAEDYQEINARIDAIEVSEVNGSGTLIIESIYK